MSERTQDLTQEIATAGVGVGRLVRYDPRWTEAFDASADGFLRSFVGALLSLPFAMLFMAMLARALGVAASADLRLLWSAAVQQLFCVAAYPLVVGLLAKPMGYGQGYVGFVIVINWATLFLQIIAAATSVLAPFGDVGFYVASLFDLAVTAATLFIIWRTARETLSPEVPTALLMVVLWVAVQAVSSQLRDAIAPLQVG